MNTGLVSDGYAYESGLVPSEILEKLKTPRERTLLAVIADFIRRGIIDPACRQLAKLVGVTKRWIKELRKSLEKAGVLQCIERRISRNRNATNIYKLIGFDPAPLGEVQFTEIPLKANTNTKAPEPSAPATVSYLGNDEKSRYVEKIHRLENEVREMKASFRKWTTRGLQICRGRQWREKATRTAPCASVGVYECSPAERAHNARLRELQEEKHDAILRNDKRRRDELTQAIAEHNARCA